jgi:hypothetical protein
LPGSNAYLGRREHLGEEAQAVFSADLAPCTVENFERGELVAKACLNHAFVGGNLPSENPRVDVGALSA